MIVRSALALVATLAFATSAMALVLDADGVHVEPGAAAVIGVPRHGDAVAYEWTVQDPSGFLTDDDFPVIAFRWNGSRQVEDAWGRARDADVLELARGTEQLVEYAFPVNGSVHPFRVVTHSQVMSSSMTGSSQENPGSHVTLKQHHKVMTRFFPQGGHDANELLLLARAPWQGVPLSALENVTVNLADGPFERVDGGRVGHLPATWFRAPERDGGTLTVAFVNGFPYPALVRVASPPPDGAPWDAPTVFEYTLTGYREGDGPLVGTGPATRLDPPLPESAFAASTPAGPADGGTDLPLTLQDAWHAATNTSAFREWARAHPAHGAYWAQWNRDDAHWYFAIESTGDASWSTSVFANECPSFVHDDVPPCVHETAGGRFGTKYAPPSDVPLNLTAWAWPERALTVDAAFALFNERLGFDFATFHQAYFQPARTWENGEHTPATVRFSWLDERLVIDLATGGTLEHDSTASSRTLASFWDEDGSVTWKRGDYPPLALAWFTAPDGVWYATGAFSLAFLAATVLADKLPAAGALLYSRLTRADVLAHPARRRVMDVVRAEPGLATSEVAARVHASRNGTRYHLNVLAREGFVHAVRAGGFTRHFPAGHAPPRTLDAEAARLNAGAEARVLAAVRAEPGVHAAALARALDVSAPTVHDVVRRLARRGLVEKRRDGRRVRLYARA